MSLSPPKWALRFLRWYCREDYIEEFEGDLLEFFERNCARSPAKAKGQFAWDVIKTCRPRNWKKIKSFSLSNTPDMFRYALLLALRHFKRYKGSFLINLSGLAAGLTCAMLIFMWVRDEWQMDKFHERDAQLYRLISDSHSNETLLNTSSLVADQLAEELPEIEQMVHSSWGALESSLSTEQENFAVIGEFATPDFFEFFSYPLLRGKPEDVLKRPKTIALSETTARKLFRSIDILGKSLRWQWYSHQEEVEITGVYADVPACSSMQFDYVLSFDIFRDYFRERIERGNYNTRTYLTLKKGTDPEELNRKMASLMQEQYPEGNWRPFVIPYSSYYLHNEYQDGQAVGGRITYVRLFSIIALLILAIAGINFMNLSTARASRRLKEIGIKKVVGAGRRSLILQYLTESALMSGLAGLVAVAMALVLMPYFNQLTGKSLSLALDVNLWIALVVIVLITGLMAGSYPAFYLSSFRPAMVIKGKLSTTFGEHWLRRGLVVFQFGISLVLMAAVLVVHQQMRFLQNKDLGYARDQIVTFSTNGLRQEKQQELLTRLQEVPGVLSASSITHALVGGQASNADIQWPGKDPEQEIWFEHGYVNYGMLEMLDIGLLSGRYFSRERGEETNKLIINETALGIMALEDPVGQIVKIGDTDYEIIGVTRDFHFQSLHETVRPTYFRLNDRWALKTAAKIAAGEEQATLARMEDLYRSFDPGFPFHYSFLNDDYQQQYVSEKRVAMLSRYFAGLAILISCLGLLGLSAYTAERRIKEISIRKVMGATSGSIIWLLSRDFTRMVLLAIAIALPLGFWLTEYWLNTFAYRIEWQWWIFALAAATLLLITWLTVGYQTVKVARVNPVERLKGE
ncbi:MAG: FtsX-like permease family protein [Saprospiraceae bacterium]